MGRGTVPTGRQMLPTPQEVLARARLRPGGDESPARIAMAIRAELWFGTLAGARTQARAGAAALHGRSDAWKSPAIVFLGTGPASLSALATAQRSVIMAETASTLELVREISCSDPTLAAASLAEIVDVLGPIAATHPHDAVLARVAEVIEACERVTRAGTAPARSAAHRAHQRLRGWIALPTGDPRNLRTMLASYDADRADAPWDERPRLELIMALAMTASADRRPLQSLPPALIQSRWQDECARESP